MRPFGVLVVGFSLAIAAPARAEWFEHVISLEGMLVLPSFQSQRSTAFAAANFGARGSYAFGFTHDFYAVARVSSWFYEGVVGGITETTSRGTYTGDLWFGGEAIRPELGLRWKAMSGYDLAPYLEAYVGYQWSVFRNRDLRNPAGGSYGLPLSDFARGRMTVAAGVSGDLRLANMFLVGVSALWTQVLNDNIYSGDLSLSARAAYYWF